MAMSPTDLSPQCDRKLSTAVCVMEEELAVAKHRVAVLERRVRLLESDLLHWKQLHINTYEKLVKIKRDRKI